MSEFLPSQQQRPESPIRGLRHRVATIPYLEARPLTEGLDHSSEVLLSRHAPSEMMQKLQWDQADVALLPTIDLQRSDDPFIVIPAGCISTAGASMTMRVFSRVRPEKLKLLWVDAESHTAVALARLLWAHNYRKDLELIPIRADIHALPEDAEAVLLIGDKVITRAPKGFEWQLDLGAMWFEMTGLPFVWGLWAAREDTDYRAFHEILSAARRAGQSRLEQIARKYGPAAGWPEDLAVRYLTRQLQYDFTDAHVDGLEEFFDRADEAGLLEDYRPLHIYEP